MTFTADPQPTNVPPRVRLDVDTDDAGGSFTDLTITRNGKRIREQPFVGSAAALAFDYEAPFGVPVTYAASGSFLPSAVPDWSESWANLTNWSGSGFTVSGGKARSSVTAASLVRSASGTIQRLSVTDPVYVRVELLTAASVVVASIEVGASVLLTGTSAAGISGGGSFTATLTNGVISVASVGSSWSLTRAYSGTPTKVRLVSLGVSYPAGLSFSTTGIPFGVALDASGNIFAVDRTSSLVRKFNTAGTQTLSFSTTGVPYAIAVDGSGNIYVADATGNLVRKYNTAGTQTLQFSTTGRPVGVAVDSSGNIYVADQINRLVRKYNTAGTQTLSFSTTGSPNSVAVDSSGSIYVGDDSNTLLRKFNTAGTQALSFSTTGQPYGIAVDGSGNIYVADATGNLVRKYNTAGTQVVSFGASGTFIGVALDASGSVLVADAANSVIRKFVATTPSVGIIVETPAANPQAFNATVTATLDVPEVWLIHPTTPSLSIAIEHGPQGAHTLRFIEASSGESKSSQAVSTVHRPVGRKKAVVITSGPRQADEWTLVVGAPTIAQKNAVRAIVDDQTPLLLRIPPAMLTDLPDDWYSVGDVTVARVEVPVITEETLITLPLTPVDEPIVRQGALWTYGSDLIGSATYADSRAKFPTYLDRLAGAS